MSSVSCVSQANLNNMFFSACPKFCSSSAEMRSTPGVLFAFRPLDAFSNSYFKIESPLPLFCISHSFSMRSATTSPLYRLSMYSTHLPTVSLLSINASLFLSPIMFALIRISPKLSLIFLWYALYFLIINIQDLVRHMQCHKFWTPYLISYGHEFYTGK